LQVWFQNARAKHRRALLKHGLSEQQEQGQPPSHQQFYHQHQQQQQQQQNTVAAAGGGTLLQSTTSATITHQLTPNPVDDRITDFSLYENSMCEYSCVTK